METTEAIVVFVTAGAREQAEQIATALVSEELAACVNIVGPIESIYRWDGQVQHDQEVLLIIKTRAALYEALEARVRVLHTYETPEVIALPVVAGSHAYLAWLSGATRAPRG